VTNTGNLGKLLELTIYHSDFAADFATTGPMVLLD
jgi:hypothetical protein